MKKIVPLLLLLLLLISGIVYMLWQMLAPLQSAPSAVPTDTVKASAALPPPTATKSPAPSAEPPTPSPTPQESPVPSPTPSPSPTPTPSETDPAQSRAEQLLAGMTLEEKLCQMLIVTPEVLTGVSPVTRAGDATRQALEAYPVGGLIYFSGNLIDRDQVTEMIANTQAYIKDITGIPLFISVDEEGGAVARCAKALGTTAFKPMAEYGKDGSTEAVYHVGETIGQDIAQFGFNLDFAPDADVLVNPDNTEIGDRSFGSDPELVAGMVADYVLGLRSAGVMAALKHFPGHGSTTVNSHYGTSVTDRTLDEMKACELLPFAAGIEQGAEFVMVSHMTAENLDTVPCSLSKTVITGLLRAYLGYEGIVITDSLSMEAVASVYTPEQYAPMAVEAGADMLLGVADIGAVITALTQAVDKGEITEDRIDESVLRILKTKLNAGLPQ